MPARTVRVAPALMLVLQSTMYGLPVGLHVVFALMVPQMIVGPESVGVGVEVLVTVGEGVLVCVGVAVGVGVWVCVVVAVGVLVRVGVGVLVAVGVSVRVAVDVPV